MRWWTMPREIDLKGKVFGELTVTRLAGGSRGGSRLWDCQCSCGNITAVSTRHLNRKNNNVKSCGCLLRKYGSEHKDWKGAGDISGNWWSSHVTRENSQTARVRVPVTITIEQAWELFLKQDSKCALSGLPIKFGAQQQNNTASLDRIDSTKGYELGNIQWVHKHINFMKRTYSQEYFIDMCKNVARKHE